MAEAMGIWEETGGGRASVSNPLAAGPGGDPEDGRGGDRAAAAAPRVLQGALELERRKGRGASDAKNLLEHNSSERDPLDNWSVYRLYVFSSVDQAPNVMREWIYLFYCLGCLVVQMLVPAALFVNQYRSDDPDPEKRYEYKRFCPSDGKLSAKLLVFLIALMYFIKMSPLTLKHIANIYRWDNLDKVRGAKRPAHVDRKGSAVGGATPSPLRVRRSTFNGFNPKSEVAAPNAVALTDFNALEALAWKLGGFKLFMFYVDLYMQTVYVVAAYLFVLYNTDDALEIVFNALAIEFIVVFDEEAVPPLLSLQEFLFRVSPEEFSENVHEGVVGTSKALNQFGNMQQYLLETHVAGWFSGLWIRFARKVLGQNVIVASLVVCQTALALLLFYLPVCY